MTDISMRDLLQAGVHFGHQTRYWNPKMANFIFGVFDQPPSANEEAVLEVIFDELNLQE